MNRFQNRRVGLVVVIGLLGGVGWYLDATYRPNSPFGPPKDEFSSLDREKVREEAVRVANLHLDELRDQRRRLVNEHLKELSSFFGQAKKRTPEFVDDILGWGSKWRLLTDHVPYFGTDHAHPQHIADSFARHLFSRDDIERAAAQIVASLAADVESIEGAMLVKLRHDLANLPGDWQLVPLGKAPWEEWTRQFQNLGGDASAQFLKTEVVQILVSAIVAEVVLRLANRTGASAAILGGGASVSGMSLGTSLLVGVAVDQAVGWVWDAIADPRGELIRRLDERIDELHRIVVDGSEGSVGLRQQVERMAEHRDRSHRAAILNAIRGKGGD